MYTVDALTEAVRCSYTGKRTATLKGREILAEMDIEEKKMNVHYGSTYQYGNKSVHIIIIGSDLKKSKGSSSFFKRRVTYFLASNKVNISTLKWGRSTTFRH